MRLKRGECSPIRFLTSLQRWPRSGICRAAILRRAETRCPSPTRMTPSPDPSIFLAGVGIPTGGSGRRQQGNAPLKSLISLAVSGACRLLWRTAWRIADINRLGCPSSSLHPDYARLTHPLRGTETFVPLIICARSLWHGNIVEDGEQGNVQFLFIRDFPHSQT